MWCHQLYLKKMDPKAEQSPQSQGHYDLPKEPTFRFWPIPLTVSTWLHVAFGCSPLNKKKLAGRNFFPSFTSGPLKSSLFRAPCIVSIRPSICLWILAQTTGTVCTGRRRVLRRNVNVVDNSVHYFLFYWPPDMSQRAHLHVVGMLRFMSDIN